MSTTAEERKAWVRPSHPPLDMHNLRRLIADLEAAVRERDEALTALEKIQGLVHAECTNGTHVRACDYLTDWLAKQGAP